MKKMIKFLTNGVLENSNDNNSDKSLETKTNKTAKMVKKGQGPDPNKPLCKKAKELRLERKLQKLNEKNSTDLSNIESESHLIPIKDSKMNESNQSKTLQDFFDEFNNIQSPTHKLKIVIKQMNAQESTFKESYELYSKYQKTVHKDRQSDCNVNNYLNFLIESPLTTLKSDNPDIEYGSFHQQYWLDDKLIAVGVIDILPNCLSSVYFFYDTDYNHLSLGIFGALFEISTIQKWQKFLPDLKFYYMGYYIHNCPKMRYKILINPSYLLCPETYVWIEAEKCLSKLNNQVYCRLQDEDWPEIGKFEYFERKTLIYWKGTPIIMTRFLNKFPVYKNTIEKFAKLFGQYCANNIVIIGIHD